MTIYIIGDIYIAYAYDMSNSYSSVAGLALSRGTYSTMSVP
jgi:hypothetical protein